MESSNNIVFYYMTDEIEKALGDNLIKERHPNVPVMGYFVRMKNGKTHLLNRNDVIDLTKMTINNEAIY